jgi:hypothetical protein
MIITKYYDTNYITKDFIKVSWHDIELHYN